MSDQTGATRAAAQTQGSSDTDTQEAKSKEVLQLFKSDGPRAQNLAGNGFTYRHDWGNKNGVWKLTLNWGAVNCNSRVFVSACEFGGGNQCGFLGAARYTVHNVAPFNGGVSVWLEINWNSPIPVQIDYLVIMPDPG